MGLTFSTVFLFLYSFFCKLNTPLYSGNFLKRVSLSGLAYTIKIGYVLLKKRTYIECYHINFHLFSVIRIPGGDERLPSPRLLRPGRGKHLEDGGRHFAPRKHRVLRRREGPREFYAYS